MKFNNETLFGKPIIYVEPDEMPKVEKIIFGDFLIYIEIMTFWVIQERKMNE